MMCSVAARTPQLAKSRGEVKADVVNAVLSWMRLEISDDLQAYDECSVFFLVFFTLRCQRYLTDINTVY